MNKHPKMNFMDEEATDDCAAFMELSSCHTYISYITLSSTSKSNILTIPLALENE